MPNIKKIIEKMKRAPNTIKCSDAAKVHENNGYKHDRQKGSHMQYINDIGEVFTLKKESPLKAVYVKEILSRIKGK